MIGSNTKRKLSSAKDPTIVAGTGGFAATLKILEQTDQESSPGRYVGAKLSPLPDFKYRDIKRNGTALSSESSSIGSKKTNWDNANPQLSTR